MALWRDVALTGINPIPMVGMDMERQTVSMIEATPPQP